MDAAQRRSQRRSQRLNGAGGLPIMVDHWPCGGRGPVVLLHGGGQTRHSWGDTGEMLSRLDYEVMCMDLRGHGESGWDVEGRYGIEWFRDDLREVLLTFSQPAVLIGASLGGITSLLVAGEAPEDRVRGLVLVDITPRPNVNGVARIQAFMTAHPDGFETVEQAAEAVAAYLPNRKRPPNPKGLMKNLRERSGRLHWHWDPKFLKEARSDHDLNRDRLAQAARQVSVPTLLVRGEISEIVTPADAAAMLELIPHAEVVEVADAAHMVAGDHNTVFGEAVIGFLERLA